MDLNWAFFAVLPWIKTLVHGTLFFFLFSFFEEKQPHGPCLRNTARSASVCLSSRAQDEIPSLVAPPEIRVSRM